MTCKNCPKHPKIFSMGELAKPGVNLKTLQKQLTAGTENNNALNSLSISKRTTCSDNASAAIPHHTWHISELQQEIQCGIQLSEAAEIYSHRSCQR